MKKIYRYSLVALMLAMGWSAAGQVASLDEVMTLVQQSSPRLLSAAEQLRMQQLDNASVRALDDPEVEFNYLWGEENLGNRHDLRVTQSFDFATLLGAKGALAGSLNNLSAIGYESERVEVLCEAMRLCSELTYYNALVDAYTHYQSDAQSLYDAVKRKSELGGASALDVSKARSQLTSVKAMLARAQVERMSTLSQLRSLSGCPTLDYIATEMVVGEVSGDFENWYETARAHNPMLKYASGQIDAQRAQLKVDKLEWAPKINVGYMDELGAVDKYRGLTVGVSIPLWRNARKVKSAAAAINYTSALQAQQESTFYNTLQSQWYQVEGMRAVALESRDALVEADNRALLGKALESGAISVLDYIQEITLYYEALEHTLLSERDYRNSLIELRKYA